MFRFLSLFSSNEIPENHLDDDKLAVRPPTACSFLINSASRPLVALPESVLATVINELSQNDVVSLMATCSKLKRLGQQKLTHRLILRQCTLLKNQASSFGIANSTFVAHNKLELLPKYLASCGSGVQELVVYEQLCGKTNVYGAEYEVIKQALLDIIHVSSGSLTVVNILDDRLRIALWGELLSSGCKNLQSVILDQVQSLEQLAEFPSLRSLTISIEDDKLLSFETNPDASLVTSLLNLQELVLIDDEDSSLRILKLLADIVTPTKQKMSLKTLKFNHYHGINNYDHVLRNLTVTALDSLVDLSQLSTLELIINCDESHCDCLTTFLNSLAPELVSLSSVSLTQKVYSYQTPVKKHELYEQWDLAIFSFLLNLPSKDKLTTLMIKNDPSVEGKLEDGLEGNYLRRRKLYEKVLVKFSSLQSLILPNLLSSICCYEQLVSDLLWNGCGCSFCSKYLPLFDTYLMTHQYFDYSDFAFKDMISPRLFGFFAHSLSARIPHNIPVLENDYTKLASDSRSTLSLFQVTLSCLKEAPNSVSWNFHGYSTIICREFKNDNDEDFYAEEFTKFVPDEQPKPICEFDESCFAILAKITNHFFLRYLTWLSSKSPALRFVCLNGIYYTIDPHLRKITCIYDE